MGRVSLLGPLDVEGSPRRRFLGTVCPVWLCTVDGTQRR